MIKIRQGYKFIYIEIENLKLFLLLVFLAAFVGTAIAWMSVNILISPYAGLAESLGDRQIEVSPSPQATPTPELTEIEREIKEVFGKDADKAFKLLKCENDNLDPERSSRTGDHGVFQISSYWQGVPQKFLKNPKINILIAKQLYDENGQTFRIWTCGKKLKI